MLDNFGGVSPNYSWQKFKADSGGESQACRTRAIEQMRVGRGDKG